MMTTFLQCNRLLLSAFAVSDTSDTQLDVINHNNAATYWF